MIYNASDCTFHGLHEWHKAMFEKFGWMIMAIDHHHDLKLKSYQESIKHIKECINSKIEATKDEDRKDDLKILLENIKCLECDLDTLMKIKFDHNSNKKYSGNNGEKVTNCALQHWMVKKFEYLGWMCLAQKHGNTIKLRAYMDSITRLIASIEKKIGEVEEKDKKDDLEITLEHSKLLKYFAGKLLMDKHNSRNSSSSKSMRSSRQSRQSRNTMKSKSHKSKTRRSSSWF
jgi:hypothetical protein